MKKEQGMEREQLNYYLQLAEYENIRILQTRIEQLANIELIQKPTAQTLLVPVQDPINGGTFYGGEVLVTSAIVKIDEMNGWAMVLDDAPERAVSIAVLDGAFAAGILQQEIIALGLRGKQRLEQKQSETNASIQATKVAFDLL